VTYATYKTCPKPAQKTLN